MIQLYGHPFAAFAWKALIAAYERGVPFEFRMVDLEHPENQARIAELSPTGQFPALIDGGREITGSNAVVAWLDRQGDAPPLVPEDPDAAVEARMMADLFDDYVNGSMQRIVFDALRPEGERSPPAVAEGRAGLDRTYAWLERKLAGREWAIGDRFTVGDVAAAPALFYADWAHPIGEAYDTLRAYRARLLARPSVARVVDEARPYRPFFPLGAPDRD